MKLANGELLTLNGINYRIEESLGHGAVSDAYRAWLGDVPDQAVVIKLVQDEDADDPIKVAALQREAEVLRTLNAAEDEGWDSLPDAMTRLRRARETEPWRRIIALLEAGEITLGQPFVIQEFAPPAFERFAIADLADECRMVAIAKAIVEALRLTHRHNLAFKDFAPDTKGDRIRLQWLGQQQQRFALKIIDWNVTGGPEDMRQDLFFFGGHLHYLFTGRHVPLDKEGHPPANLGAGDLVWAALADGTRRLISKALQRDAKRRYQQVDVLLDDLDWWYETLALFEHADVLKKLETRLWDANSVGRFDRVFAAADLALRLQPPSEARLSFEQSRERAKKELEKEIWQPIAGAQFSLGVRAYEKAIGEFAQQLKAQPSESEAWRLAYIYQRLARMGNELRRYYQNADERRTPEWEALDTRAIPALVERRWRDAEMAFAEAARLRPECRSWDSFNELEQWARAGVTYTTTVNQAFLAAENRVDSRNPEWLTVEELSKEAHQKALEILAEVQKEALYETEFKERWTFESLSYGRRNTLYSLYKEADASLSNGQKALDDAHDAEREKCFTKAIEEYQKTQEKMADVRQILEGILAQDPAQVRARFFLRRAESLQHEAEAAEALGQARKMLESGHYDEALDLTKRVLEKIPGREDAQLLQTEAEIGSHLLQRVRDYLRRAEDNLETDDCDDAEKALNSFQGWGETPGQKTLRDLIGNGAAADQMGGRLFQLSPETKTRDTYLRRQISAVRETLSNLDAAIEEYDYAEIVRLCESHEKHYPLSAAMQRQLESAHEKLKNHSNAEALLTSLPSGDLEEDFERLRGAVDLLRNDKKPKALDLMQQLADHWVQLAQKLAPDNLEQLLNRATQGRRLFPEQTEERFSRMEEQAQRAKDVARLLAEPDGDSHYPTWFDEPDWGNKLSSIDKNLADLEGSQSWIELREEASAWRAQMKHYVETYVRVQLTNSEEQARERRFDVSLKYLTLLQQNLRQTSFGLPQDLQNNIDDLRSAQNSRLSAGEEFKRIFKQFDVGQASAVPDAQEETSAGITFQDALRALRSISLPDHAAVPINDLKTQLTEVETFAAAERALRVAPVSDLTPAPGQSNYAQVIYDCRRALELQVNALNAYDGINWRVSDLKKELRDKIDKTGEALAKTLQEAVEVQKRDPKLNPQRVVALYAQARWWQPMSSADLNPVMEDARRLPHHILTEAAQALTALHDLEIPEQKSETAIPALEKGPVLYLQHAETLNNELQYLPVNKLPPLPANVQPLEVSTGWELAGEPLEALEAAAIHLCSLLQQAAQIQLRTSSAAIETPDADAPGSDSTVPITEAVTETSVSANASVPVNAHGAPRYDSALVDLVHKTAQGLKQIVQDIGALWPALRLTWATDSKLVQLGGVAAKIVEITEYLGTAYKELVERKALQGLNILYEKLEQPNLIEELEKHSLIQELEKQKQFWLTQPLQALKVNSSALRQEMSTALGNQIADILAMPNAAEQLEREMLTQVKAGWIAETVYQALNQGVGVRAKRAEAEKRKDAAKRLWKIVMEATEYYYQQEQSGATVSAKKPRGCFVGRLLGPFRRKGNSPSTIPQPNSTFKPTSGGKQVSGQLPTAPKSQPPEHPPTQLSDK